MTDPATTAASEGEVREALLRAYDTGVRIGKGGYHNGVPCDRQYARNKRETEVNEIMRDLADDLGHEAAVLATPATPAAPAQMPGDLRESYERLHAIAYLDEAKALTVCAADLRAILAALQPCAAETGVTIPSGMVPFRGDDEAPSDWDGKIVLYRREDGTIHRLHIASKKASHGGK